MTSISEASAHSSLKKNIGPTRSVFYILLSGLMDAKEQKEACAMMTKILIKIVL